MKHQYYKQDELYEIMFICVNEVVVIDELTTTYDLKEIFDSLDYVEFIMNLEKEFDISISDEIATEFEVSKDKINILDILEFLDVNFNIHDIIKQRSDKIEKIKGRWGYENINT